MKIVLNVCNGIFCLSSKAIEECIGLGMTVTETNANGKPLDYKADFRKLLEYKWFFGERYVSQHSDEKSFRTNPILVSVVEKLGEEASGECAKLVVKELYCNDLESFKIKSYNGYENIIYLNRGEESC